MYKQNTYFTGRNCYTEQYMHARLLSQMPLKIHQLAATAHHIK